MLDLAIVHLAGFLGKLLADIIRVGRQVVAQFFQLFSELLLLRRNHCHRGRRLCDRRGCGFLGRRDNPIARVLAGKTRRHDRFLDLGGAA